MEQDTAGIRNGATELLRAADFAARRHRMQRRKGESQEPYVNHLIEVARLLADATNGDDLTLIIAGLLHDTVEDVGVTLAELELEFGPEVAALVMEVTDDKSLPKAERKRLQVANTPHKSVRARMLKLADKTSNLRAIRVSPPPDWTLERKIAYFEWANEVVVSCRGLNGPLEAAFDAAFESGMASLRAESEHSEAVDRFGQ